MTTISRKQFVAELVKDQGGLNVNELPAEVQAKLEANGVKVDDLKKIAGADGRISGEKEMSQLFNLVDRFDHDGGRDTFDAGASADVPTPSGALYDALKAEVARNRASAQNKGIIHLGMREPSKKEAEALEKANPAKNGGVVRVQAYDAPGVIDYGGTKFDLKNGAGLDAFKAALGKDPDHMPAAQAEAFVTYLATQQPPNRDELAQLGLDLFRAGEGKLPVSRMVISGHGDPAGDVFGDGDGEQFSLEDIKNLAKVFPQGAGKIEHVAVSACFGASQETFDTLRTAFPNLKSAFGYNYFAPLADGRSPQDLTRWAKMTSGDPSQVDPTISKTATWNIVDGAQGLPKGTVPQMEQRQKELEPVYEAYKSGKLKPENAQHDPRLDDYYARLADLRRNPDISPERKAEVQKRLDEVLELRHPGLGQ